MRRIRYEYYFKAIICFIFGIIFTVILPIMKPDFFIRVGISLGMGIGIGILFFVVALINYGIARKDASDEKAKDDRIKELEKEVNKLKDYEMKDFKYFDYFNISEEQAW